MTGLADQFAAAGQPIAVFADRLRTAGLAELQRPYPIRRFGSIRPLRVFSKRRAVARAASAMPISGVFADSWKSVGAIPSGLGPIAALAHGTEFPPTPPAGKAKRIRAAFARCKTIIASSNYTASLAREYVQGDVEIIVINPPIAPLPVAGPASLARIDAIIAGRGPVVSTLARLEARKGVDAVIRGLAEPRGRHPQLVYVIAGGGADRLRLESLVAECGVAECVVFLGEVTDTQTKAALLTRSDIYAMPSRRVGHSVEGFGIAYIEAGWYGAPALAGRDGGAVDAVLDGQTGLVCDSADQNDVTATLARLLDDAPLRQRLGDNAAAHARTQTWDAVLPRYLHAIGL